jgi:hypothetical protein
MPTSPQRRIQTLQLANTHVKVIKLVKLDDPGQGWSDFVTSRECVWRSI